MTLNAALKRMEREMVFLGVDEIRLHNLLATTPGMFSSKTLEAWSVVLTHEESAQ